MLQPRIPDKYIILQAGQDPDSAAPGWRPLNNTGYRPPPSAAGSLRCQSLFRLSSEWGVAHSVWQLQAQQLCLNRERWSARCLTAPGIRHLLALGQPWESGSHTMACSWVDAVRTQRAHNIPRLCPLTERSQTQPEPEASMGGSTAPGTGVSPGGTLSPPCPVCH